MKIKKENIGTGDYYVVIVDADELVVESGKKLRYSAYIGTFRKKGDQIKIDVWTPAGGGIPRGYKPAAKTLLELAALKTFG